MGKIAFLFAGQGTQAVGMSEKLYQNEEYVKSLFDSYSDIRDLCFTGPTEVLNQTQYAQKSILLASVVTAKFLESKGIKADMVAGLSLGEYSALCYANAFDLDSAIKIVTKRGEIMQNALPAGTTGMAAVLGLDGDKIAEVLKDIEGVIEIANYNCPGQIVITGEVEPLDKACTLLKAAGARRCVKLNVSGAFHSSLLEEASNLLEAELNTYEINKPALPVVFNTYGDARDVDIVNTLKLQIKSSVRFSQSISYMIEQGVDTFIECGPGAALSGFVKRVNPNVKIYNTNTYEDVLKVIEEVK